MMTISIPIAPYLRDYLISQFGEEPIRFDQRSDEARRLTDLLNKPVPGKINQGNLAITLPGCDYKRPEVYNYLSDNSISVFRNYIYVKWWDTFREEIRKNAHVYPGILRKDNINMVLEKYDIESENLDFETCKKHYYRAVKKTIKRHRVNFATLTEK